MNEHALPKDYTLASLPPEWPQALMPDIRICLNVKAKKVVVLDDDPTGTQTVHGIHVLTEWPVPSLASELSSDAPAFYILTNSRSLGLDDAQAMHREIGANLKAAAGQVGVEMEVVSRSDSTLRGHFPGETDVLAQALGLESPPYLIIPFFLEGGRYTIGNIHYAAEGDVLVPAAQTSYAQDAVFGYAHSDLREWVEEKTGRRIPVHKVACIPLEILRRGEAGEVTRILTSLEPGSACIVNAASYRDMEVFVIGLLAAEAQGSVFLPRTAASFVRVRAGISPQPLLEYKDLTVGNTHGGLFIVGSYVPKTTAQVQRLYKETSSERIEVNVEHLLDEETGPTQIQAAVESADGHLAAGRDVVVFTSRDLVKGADLQSNLQIGRRVSDSLIAIVRGIRHQPRYLVAKGGITSSDIATKGLEVQRALVMGQVLPGVPVWRLGEESRYPGMPYIVFPGNVGELDALVQIQKRLTI
jgi:uncharacterized protein YgbK (DUF1537 family)